MTEQNFDEKILSDVGKKHNHNDVFHEREYGMKISDNQFQCSVGIIDMINSTKITSICEPSKLNKYYGLFLNTMIPAVTKFGGVIAKITGDGFLYYFPDTSEDKKKNVARCLNCNSMMTQSHADLSDALNSEHLPSIDYRVSSEFGNLSISSIKLKNVIYDDIFGTPVNLSAKINSLASPNSFVIGNEMFNLAKDIPGFRFKKIKSLSHGFFSYGVYSAKSKV